MIKLYHASKLWLVLAFLLISCAGGAQSASEEASLPNPSPAELTRLLHAEFDRLGIDPTKVVASDPSGQLSSVLDLAAEVVDPDGAGPLPPTGVQITWTERFPGDYDQNGVVGIGDLTPLGQHLDQTVPFTLGNELWAWPEGSATDDGNMGGLGSGYPPTPGSGAEHWRLGRIDGDGNGEINLADITPIAEHWNQQLQGYCILRWAPDTEFPELVLNPDDPASPYTIPREAAYPDGGTSPDPNRPVTYEFLDVPPDFGVYRYQIGFTAQSMLNKMGWVDANYINNGTGNQLPVPSFSATPQAGPAPLTVSFDPSASYDPNGTIVDFDWDLDNDGVVDRHDSAPVVFEHVYAEPGSYHPRLWVYDNQLGWDDIWLDITVTAP